MTQEQKRIKLAEYAGWKGISRKYLTGYAPWRPVTYEERIQKTPVMEFHSIPLDPLPDYFNDLNVVHEWEKTLRPRQRDEYNENLEALVGPQDGWQSLYMWHATAAQRAEALGRTLNLWTE
jgi:hypothetical protein